MGTWRATVVVAQTRVDVVVVVAVVRDYGHPVVLPVMVEHRLARQVIHPSVDHSRNAMLDLRLDVGREGALLTRVETVLPTCPSVDLVARRAHEREPLGLIGDLLGRVGATERVEVRDHVLGSIGHSA